MDSIENWGGVFLRALYFNLALCVVIVLAGFPLSKAYALPGGSPQIDLPDFVGPGPNHKKKLPRWTSLTSISITSPRHGSAIYEREGHSQTNYIPYPPRDNDPDSLGFDENWNPIPLFETGSLRIEGFIHNVKKRWVKKGRIEVLIDGVRTSLSTRYNRKRKGYHYSLWVPMPKPEEYGAPLSQEFGWPQRLLTVEVYDTKTNTVLARTHSVYFDLRGADTANHAFDAYTEIPGMHAQLTNLGVGGESVAGNPYGLEIPHLTSLPHPNLQTFNDELTIEAQKSSDYGEDNIKACISLNDISEKNFRNELKFPALTSIKLLATGYYQSYLGIKNGTIACNAVFPVLGQAVCDIAVDNMCVKAPPKTSDFELCVDRIEGEPQSASIDSIDDISLEFKRSINGLDYALLESDIVVSGLVGRVNGKFRDLTLRWIDKGIPCVLRPNVNVSNEFIVDKDWANEWATCRNIEIKNDTGSTAIQIPSLIVESGAPAKFMLSPTSRDSENLKVYQTSDPSFYFGATDVDYEKGACGEDFIKSDAEEMAKSFTGVFTRKFTELWNKGDSFTDQAKMLEALLSPYELGKVYLEDHDVIAHYETIKSNITDVVKGAGIGYETVVLPDLQVDWNRFDNAMLYVPPRLEDDDRFFPQGINDDGQEFDASFSLTTGYLNQKLNALGATSRLNFNLQPTRSDLGLISLPPESFPPLNREILEKFNPIFADLGAKEIQIKVSPSLDPIVWMEADPPGEEELPGVRFPLAYGVWALDVKFAAPDRIKRKSGKVIPGKVWLHVQVFVHDSDFRLNLARDNGETMLHPVLEDEEWFLRIVDNNFSTCDMVATNHGFGPNNCEDLLERDLLSMVKRGIRERLISMVSDIPAPQFFDAEGESDRKMQTEKISILHEGQHINIYADFGEVYD